jgi:hypothetical protein
VWAEFLQQHTSMPHVAFAEVDCTAHPDLCRRVGVSAFPTLRLYRDGAQVHACACVRLWVERLDLAFSACPRAVVLTLCDCVSVQTRSIFCGHLTGLLTQIAEHKTKRSVESLAKFLLKHVQATEHKEL